MSIRWWRQYSFEDWLFNKYINRTHALVRLADRIDWQRIDEDCVFQVRVVCPLFLSWPESMKPEEVRNCQGNWGEIGY